MRFAKYMSVLPALLFGLAGVKTLAVAQQVTQSKNLPPLKLLKLSKDAMLFKSSDGRTVVYGDDWGERIFMSSNDRILYEVKRTSFGGRAADNKIGFEDPYHNRIGELELAKGKLVVGGTTYTRWPCPSQIRFVPLPTVRAPEYLFSLPNGKYLYVSADKYHYNYDTFRLFVGSANALKQVRITRIPERLRDGGTTFIETAQGMLYSPAGNARKESGPTWKSRPIMELDPEKYSFRETGNTVSVSKK